MNRLTPDRRSASRPSVAARLIALLISIALIMMGMEFYARLIADDGMDFNLEMWKYANELKRVSDDPRIGHEHRPNSTAYLMGADVSISSLGLRSPEFDRVKSSDTLRILMLGDSILFGWGVASDNTISRQLEDQLRVRFPGRRIEVINAGVGNYNTDMAVSYFLAKGKDLAPDIVVLNYFINDTEPTPRYSANVLTKNSYALIYFGGLFDQMSRAVLGKADWETYYRTLYDPTLNAAGMSLAADAIARLADAARRQNMTTILVNYPELRVLKPYPFDEASHWVKDQAARNGLPYLDLLDSVRDFDPRKLWVTVPDPHPNAQADRLFAERLAAFLSDEIAKH